MGTALGSFDFLKVSCQSCSEAAAGSSCIFHPQQQVCVSRCSTAVCGLRLSASLRVCRRCHIWYGLFVTPPTHRAVHMWRVVLVSVVKPFSLYPPHVQPVLLLAPLIFVTSIPFPL